MDRINWKKKKRRTKKKIKLSTVNHKVVVFRSNKHIYGQLIDVENGKTLTSSSSLDKDLIIESSNSKGGKIEVSKLVAKALSSKIKSTKIENVIFDRNGYRYHGRIKAFADSLRENGIKF